MDAKAKILIVDDDIDIQLLLATRLRKAGYDVITAGDGVGCMQQAHRGQPDILVLDLGIPGGDGFTSLQRMRSSPRFVTTPIVVLTANEDFGVEERARKLGANEFVNKSAGTDALLSAVERCLVSSDQQQPTPPSNSTQRSSKATKRAEPVEEIELNVVVGTA